MRPLPVAATGLVVVAIDLRFDRFDLLADPVGWLLVAEACRRLALRTPMWAAALAALLSTSEVWLPHHLVLVDPGTGRAIDRARLSSGGNEQLRFGHVTGLQLGAMALTVVVGGLAVWLLLHALLRVADDDVRRLSLLRWVVPLAWTAPFLAVAAVEHDGFDPVWNGTGKEYLWLVGVLALLAVAAQLVAVSGKRWALPPPEPLRAL